MKDCNGRIPRFAATAEELAYLDLVLEGWRCWFARLEQTPKRGSTILDLATCGFPPRDSRPFVLLSRLESSLTFRDARFVDPNFSVIQNSKYSIEPRDILLLKLKGGDNSQPTSMYAIRKDQPERDGPSSFSASVPAWLRARVVGLKSSRCAVLLQSS
jgi:hypothetical protein